MNFSKSFFFQVVQQKTMHRTDGNCFPSLLLPKESREDEILRKFPSNRSFIISLRSLCIAFRHFPRMYRNLQIIFKIQLLFLKAENKQNTIYKITPSENSKTALGNLESISASQNQTSYARIKQLLSLLYNLIIMHLFVIIYVIILLLGCCSNWIFNIFQPKMLNSRLKETRYHWRQFVQPKTPKMV